MAAERTAGVGATTYRAARNASVRGLAEILGKFATLAWTVAAARILSQEDFGAVSYAMALMYLLSSFAAWGFDSGVVRRGSAEVALLPRVYLGSQVWKTALAALVFGGAALLALESRPTLASWFVLVLMLLAGFPELWSHTARAVASVRQSPAGVSTALVVQRLVTAAMIVAALVAGLGPLGLAAGFLVGTLAGWAAHHVAVRRLDVRPGLRGLTRTDLRTAASGTFLIGVSGLALMLLFRVDVVLLGPSARRCGGRGLLGGLPTAGDRALRLLRRQPGDLPRHERHLVGPASALGLRACPGCGGLHLPAVRGGERARG